MALFESLVLLLFVAALLLAGSRRLGVPYPTLLAVAGVAVALLPFAPKMTIEPHLALAIFIAPALFDAAYGTAPRELRKLWMPLLALAVGAVLFTTAAVAFVGWHMAGLPIAAAIVLGAIVAPPDAAAANAVLGQIGFPRHSTLVLAGESLLNDATALLIFGGALAAVGAGLSGGGTLQLAVAVPGGILVGVVLALVYTRLVPFFAATLAGIIVEFTATFGCWIIAERLHVSPVLAVVAFAMLLARSAPGRQSARDRVQSYSVWAAAVFVLNVLAFLLMGLQAREILSALHGAARSQAIVFALTILLVTIVVRMATVLGYRTWSGWTWRRYRPAWLVEPPPWRVSFLVSWCGMRGLLTLATAFALPAAFPGRSLIVLTAFTVVLGTLVVQGLTLKPLMRLLSVGNDDDTLSDELGSARTEMLAAGRSAADREPDAVAAMLVAKLDAATQVAETHDDPQGPTRYDTGLAHVVAAQRDALNHMRDDGRIADDVFHHLQEELDWLELAARPNRELEVRET